MNTLKENNLEIWNQVEQTDHSATKKAKVNGMDITSINGTSVVKKATEIFGPVGIGWGYKIVEEHFKPGAPIVVADKVFHELMHTIKIQVWYKQNDEKHTVTHYGHTPYVRSTQHGLKTDFDAPKKSLTDALKKALSMLGFNADVFLGMWDDQNYVQAAQLKETIEQADNQDEARAQEVEKFENDLDKNIQLFKSAQSKATIQAMVAACKSKFTRRAQALGRDPNLVCTYIDEMAREIANQKFTEKGTQQ